MGYPMGKVFTSNWPQKSIIKVSSLVANSKEGAHTVARGTPTKGNSNLERDMVLAA